MHVFQVLTALLLVFYSGFRLQFMCPFITFGPSNQNSMSQPDSSSGGGSSVSSEKQSKLLVSKGPSTCSKQTVYVYYFPKLIFSVPKATYSKEIYSIKTATLPSNISDQSRIMSGIVFFFFFLGRLKL